MAIVTAPDYLFSGFYYPEILVSLQTFMEVNAPELSSLADEEPHIQLMRAFALVGHLNNTRTDIVANELLVDSLTLRESMVRVFKLIGVKLTSATPATTTQVIELSGVPTVDETAYVPAYSQFQTEAETADEVNVVFEATEDKARARGDQVSHVFIATEIESGADGIVSTALPNQLTSATGPFTVADVGRSLIIFQSANGNEGEYEISTYIDANTIEVADGSFTSESDLIFRIKEYSDDFATEANDSLLTFSPFPPTTAPSEMYILYIGHDDLQWNQIDFSFDTPNIEDIDIALEYYDPTHSNSYPNSITDSGGFIGMNIDSLVKSSATRSGMSVSVTYNPTGVTENCISWWDVTNTNNIFTRGLLGQSVVDTDPLQYTVHADWLPVGDQDDGTLELTQDGEYTFRWPMSTSVKWQKATVENKEAYWLRLRVINIDGTIDSIVMNRIQVDQGKEYFPFEIIQGQTILTEVIGSSNGLEDQSMSSGFGPVFDDSWTLEIDETGGGTWVEWVAKDSLQRSSSTDRHYKWEYNTDGSLRITYGNDINGRIPPLGVDNARLAKYRIGGNEDGNVGSYKITENVDGISYVAECGNPIAATGWTIKEAGNATDLERMKDAGPAQLRNDGKAVASADIASIAINEYKDSNGSSPVARAYVVEEAYGPKTVQLVVVGTGGNFLDASALEELETYYNGNRYAYPPEYGALAMNHELTAVNYDPSTVDVEVLVIGKGITSTAIKNALLAYLDPLVKNDDGDYIHNFGGKVATSLLDVAIGKISNNITNIIRTIPSADVTMGPMQLPAAGTINVTVSETE